MDTELVPCTYGIDENLLVLTCAQVLVIFPACLLSVEALKGTVAGNIRCGERHLNINQCRCYGVRLSSECVGSSVLSRLFWRWRQEAPVSWFEVCCTCCHFLDFVQTEFCFAFRCPINVVEIRQKYDPLFKGFWIPPVQKRQNMHLSGCRVQFLVNPGFVPYFTQFCCPIVGWIWILRPQKHSVQSENTWSFTLIRFAAASSSRVIRDQRNVFQSHNTCMVYASLSSVSVCTSRCKDCINPCNLEKHSFIATRFKLLVILAQPKTKPRNKHLRIGSKSVH